MKKTMNLLLVLASFAGIACGFFDDRVAPDTQFERPVTGTPPTIDFSELE